MISDETIEVSITYGKTLTFFLRMVGITQENKYRQKLFGITEAERDEKEYQANVELLAELSEKQPDGIFEDGVSAKGLPDAIVRDFFAERTVRKERIAYYAVRSYFTRLQPSESFL